MRGLSPRFVQDRRGGVSIIVAASSLMIVGFAAAVVDMGSIYLQTRELQGIADMAALAAARDIPNGQAAAQATADMNGWEGGVVTEATFGAYSQDGALAASARFQPDATPANAVRVKAKATADLYFARAFLGKSGLTISRTATAARAEMASFSVGSRLAALNGGVANSLLEALTGSSVSLSVMDYNALAAANVDLLKYAKALRTQADMEAATFGETLGATVTAKNAIGAAVGVLTESGQTAAASALSKIGQAATSAPNITLASLIDLGPYSDQDHHISISNATISLSALDLAKAVLMTAQGGRQVEVDLAVSAPGLTDIDVWLAIGERPAESPWVAVARKGDEIVVRTAQMRLYSEIKAASGLGLLGVQPIVLPILLEAAPAEAKLSSIVCPQVDADQSASLLARTGIAAAYVTAVDKGQLKNFNKPIPLTPAALVDLNLGLLSAKVTGKAKITLGGQSWQTVKFTRADIAGAKVKTISTNDAVQSATASLVQNMDLGVNVSGIGLSTAGVTAPLLTTLGQVAPSVDSTLNALTDLLGVKLGQADLQVHGLRCRDAALVS